MTVYLILSSWIVRSMGSSSQYLEAFCEIPCGSVAESTSYISRIPRHSNSHGKPCISSICKVSELEKSQKVRILVQGFSCFSNLFLASRPREKVSNSTTMSVGVWGTFRHHNCLCILYRFLHAGRAVYAQCSCRLPLGAQSYPHMYQALVYPNYRRQTLEPFQKVEWRYTPQSNVGIHHHYSDFKNLPCMTSCYILDADKRPSKVTALNRASSLPWKIYCHLETDSYPNTNWLLHLSRPWRRIDIITSFWSIPGF